MTGHYLRFVRDGLAHEPWVVEEDVAHKLGEDPMGGITAFRPEPGETALESVARLSGWDVIGTFTKLRLPPGHYYRRISRPISGTSAVSPSATMEADALASFKGQLTVLVRQLQRISQTVHPAEENASAFGNDIRNLIILACTEVEAHWKGILVANGHPGGRTSTNDYSKLAAIMGLADFSVGFPSYPWLDAVQPFHGWDPQDPTNSLGWFADHHGLKHDREREFHRATLRNAFLSVTACAVMLVAQFGKGMVLTPGSELRTFFRFESFPTLPIDESYIPLGYGFDAWVALEHPDIA